MVPFCNVKVVFIFSEVNKFINSVIKTIQLVNYFVNLKFTIFIKYILCYDKNKLAKEVVKMTTGEKIRARRELLGLTQVEVAKRLNVTKSYINRMEHDVGSIPLKRIADLASALSCNPAELIGDYHEAGGTIAELDVIASQLDAESIGLLIQYAKFLAREKGE